GVPQPQLRPRLYYPHVRERGRSRPQNLAHPVARHLQLAHDLLDRLAPDKVLTPDPADRLHNQHPPPPARVPKRVSLHITAQRGVKVGRRSPLYRGQSSTPKHRTLPSNPADSGREVQ